MPTFEQDVVAAVAAHMNTDHPEDNLVIVRAHAVRTATAATLATLDASGATWRVRTAEGESSVTIPWPAGPISERPEIRRQIVSLYRSGCAALGIVPRTEEARPGAHPDSQDSRSAGH